MNAMGRRVWFEGQYNVLNVKYSLLIHVSSDTFVVKLNTACSYTGANYPKKVTPISWHPTVHIEKNMLTARIDARLEYPPNAVRN